MIIMSPQMDCNGCDSLRIDMMISLFSLHFMIMIHSFKCYLIAYPIQALVALGCNSLRFGDIIWLHRLIDPALEMKTASNSRVDSANKAINKTILEKLEFLGLCNVKRTGNNMSISHIYK